MKKQHNSIFLRALFLILISSVSLAVLPETVTQVVDGQWTLQLTRQSFRGANFEVLVQNNQGGYDAYDPGEVRTYIGTVDEDASASVAAYYKQDGTLLTSIIFDRGGHYLYDGDTQVANNGWMAETLRYPTQLTVSAGYAGTTMYEYGIGYDIDYASYSSVYGSSFQSVVNFTEFCHLHMAQIQMRNWIIKPVVERVIIRASQTQDPHSGGMSLTALRDEWINNQADAMGYCFKVAGASVTTGGGVAYISGQFSVNGIKTDSGFFYGTMRHEVGHNWGILDYDGGSPEGVTINCGNGYARHCGTAVQDALKHRDKYTSSYLSSIGTYTAVDIPPYAALDVPQGTIYPEIPVTIDVLANDFDANGDGLSILSYDSLSALSGTVQVSSGTGAGGRDELVYTPSAEAVGMTDSFYYQIVDSTGQTATGAVVSTTLIIPLSSHDTDADTYVDDDTNHGMSETIVVKRSSAGAGSTWTRTGWVHFDTTDMTVSTLPQLTFTIRDTASTIFYVWGIKDGRPGDALGVDWTEDGLTKANAPLLPDFAEDADTTLVGSASPGLAGERLVIRGNPLRDFLLADTNDEVTFLLTRNVDDSNFSLNSRENIAGGSPVLEMMPPIGTADAYVRGSVPRGFESQLEVKNDINSGFIRETYLRFNYMGEGTGWVENATLTLIPVGIEPGRTLRIRLTDDSEDLWEEALITADNQPVSSGLEIIFSSDEFVLNQPYAIDVTSLLNQAMNANSIATFHIEALTQNSTGLNKFASKEHETAAWHPVLDVTIDDVVPPAAPTGLTATPGDSVITLDWADNSELDLAGYRVYRGETSGGPFDPVETGITASEYVDNTVTNGTTYYYVVKAVDTSDNESDYSSQADARPRGIGDINGSGFVNLSDFAILASYWSQDCQSDPLCDAANLDNLNGVDLDDFMILAEHWLDGL